MTGKGNCKSEEIVYEIVCQACKAKYFGESARNARSRSVEHVMKSQSTNEKVREKSFIFNHLAEHHPESLAKNNMDETECDENTDSDAKAIKFSMKVLKSYQNHPT